MTNPLSNPRVSINIVLGTLPSFETSAALFPWLCFPGAGDEKQRAEARAALCHVAVIAELNENRALRSLDLRV